MTEFETAIQSIRRAPAPWDEARAAAVFAAARRRRVSSGFRRMTVLFALGIAASLGAWALFARASEGIDGDGPAGSDVVANPSNQTPTDSNPMAGAALADGGFVMACNSCHRDESRWRIDRGSIVHGRYE